MVKTRKFPKWRVTIRKVKLGYIINVNGKVFDETNNKRRALSTAKWIREQQGKIRRSK